MQQDYATFPFQRKIFFFTPFAEYNRNDAVQVQELRPQQLCKGHPPSHGALS